MENKDKLRHIPGKDGLFYFVNSDTLDDDLEFIRSKKIENIALNPFHGYKIDDINWLDKTPFIKKAEFGGCYDINFDGLKYLTKLEHLTFFPAKNQKVDFSNLNKLTSLCFRFNNNMTGFENLKLLESLVISKAEISFFDSHIFESYSRLKILSIAESKLPEPLQFLTSLSSLTHLQLNYIKSKIDLLELEKLAKSLEVFKLDHSKKVESFDTVKKLKKLKTLSVVDSIQLENAKFVDDLPQLETLIILGSSYFIDGNLTNLKRLKHVSIDDKRHYNLKYEDLKGY